MDPRDDVSEPESEHNRMTRLGGRRGRFIARQLDYGLPHKSQIGVGHLPVHFSLHFDLLHFFAYAGVTGPIGDVPEATVDRTKVAAGG